MNSGSGAESDAIDSPVQGFGAKGVLNTEKQFGPVEESQKLHAMPPFLSNSDGAKYIKEQASTAGLKQAFLRRQSHAVPIFLGGKFLNKTLGNARTYSTATDDTNESAQDGAVPSPYASSNYFLFPSASGDDDPAGVQKTKSTSSLDAQEMEKSASFSNLAEVEDAFADVRLADPTSPALAPVPSVFQRRKSVSGFHRDSLQSEYMESDNALLQRRRPKKRTTIQMGQVPRLGRRADSLKGRSRSSTIDSGSSLSKRRSTRFSNLGDMQRDLMGGRSNSRSRSKAFSQAEGINHRFLQSRLRVGYISHEFLRELRRKRKSRARSRVKILTPFERFQRIAQIIRLLLRCLDNYRKISVVSHVSQMSFAMLSSDMVTTRTYREGLTFDPNDYRAVTEGPLNDEVKYILTIVPEQRSDKQIEYVLKRLRSCVDEFAEFPLRMQEALVRVAWLDEFEPKRIVIRQGHKAETFYFIISGTALVTRNRISHTGEGYVETVNILKRGKSFGELAIMRHEQRTNNVVCQTHLTLLTASRKDFVEIFMHRMDGDEPEFMTFLRTLPEFKGYPLYKLPRNKPKICAFTYFRVGVVICPNSNQSDVIVIVKSGFCRVVKCLRATRPNIHGLRGARSDLDYEKTFHSGAVSVEKLNGRFGTERPVVLTSPTSPVSLLTGPTLPSLMRRLTLPMVQKYPTDKVLPNAPESLRQFAASTQAAQNRTLDAHKSAISLRYKKWQDEHPISRETFALLMTGRDVEVNEVDEEENEEESRDSFDAQHERNFDYFCQQQLYAAEEDRDDDRDSRRGSTHSNFRTQILKRNRASLVDAWGWRQRKKASSTVSNLPTLNENVLPRPSFVQTDDDAEKGSKPTYIHVQTLGERDVFGLLPILFDKSEGATPVSLISEGAECILINKEFFLKHFDDELRESLIRKVRPYPTEESLQTSMQDQANWDAYKFMTVHAHVTQRIKSKHVVAPKALTVPVRAPNYKYLFS